MRRWPWMLGVQVLVIAGAHTAGADVVDRDETNGSAETVDNAVRVVIIRSGGEDSVASIDGRPVEAELTCEWSVVITPGLEDVYFGVSAGPRPHPDAQFAMLLCDGEIYRPFWLMPGDIIDLDATARAEAERYIDEVLVPAVGIGVNPAARGLVGLRSWFWVEGFDGTVFAPPITTFGLTIEVRMTSSHTTWDFGDGTSKTGDLGRAYPAESTVQHAHQRDGTFTITATIELVPEYRVDGGPWITLPNLQAIATATHAVQERQAVVTHT